MTTNDSRTLAVQAKHGRDVGKTFHIVEFETMAKTALVLRAVSALRVDSVQDVVRNLSAAAQEDSDAAFNSALKLLHGADSAALQVLLNDLLDGVQIAPDARHPGSVRALERADIRELRTLGDVLFAVVKVNFMDGA
ncbi:hypothetical protein T2_00037 [Ralstonia phage Elie]|uniref:Uncharacterized protein n=4 Tax=Bakolyvirus TaxID=2843355 RepID=A0A7G5BBR6_9CAUD|nr:tail assembly chaperone [Ralstonia phage Adzire]YP_010052770.1 tail assembly chaperone [Ralstonia phage Bakoly]YP_010077724.1 tail assembly chaperone [Ralstonia phage Simangalove]QMV32982.1 hypothetical protein T2_00037 [Ralstonia phage Elie]QMV33549.1 hypothetical protein 30B_00042 [Ralstonia phage Jenny]QMV33694.1 hypothetical protein S3_00050 [Ralstonia phage Sarlave]QMV32354.1 hypothetical protein S1_00037 [Ralstonia phage Adzire]QMV32594.1 hypothetical protein 2B_00021 [Ralstonia pha